MAVSVLAAAATAASLGPRAHPPDATTAAKAPHKNGRIAYTHANKRIFTVKPNGKRRRAIRKVFAPTDLAWAPSGKKIALASFASTAYGEIYVMTRQGKRLSRLVAGSANVSSQDPTWARNSRKIAYSRAQLGAGTTDIFVVGLKRRKAKQLTTDGKSSEPDWSPDGKRFAFVSQRDGNYEIYVMSAKGTGAVRVTSNPADDRDPDWAPNGKRIVFWSSRDGNSEIYTVSPSGQGLKRLTRNGASDGAPAWSPDGKRIAFVSNRRGSSDIYVMNARGRGVKRVARSRQSETSPTWEPRP